MLRPGSKGGGREYKYCEPGSHHCGRPALAAGAPTRWGSAHPKGPFGVLGQAGGLPCGGRTQTGPPTPGTEPLPLPLPPRLQAVLVGGLLGSLPPQPHKRLGLSVTLPALQQLQDQIPVGCRVGEGQAGLRHFARFLHPCQAGHGAQWQEGLPLQVISPQPVVVQHREQEARPVLLAWLSRHQEFKGLIKQRVKVLLVLLGLPGGQLRELMPGFQGQLDKGVAGAIGVQGQ